MAASGGRQAGPDCKEKSPSLDEITRVVDTNGRSSEGGPRWRGAPLSYRAAVTPNEVEQRLGAHGSCHS
jgi:hypothetical protein